MERNPTYDPNPDKPVVYVAGPYTADTEAGIEANIQRATWAAAAIMEAGYYPFVPHFSKAIDDYHHDHTGERIPWERWMDWSCVFLVSSQAMYVVGESVGTCIEMRIARELGIPIVTTIDDLREALGD